MDAVIDARIVCYQKELAVILDPPWVSHTTVSDHIQS